MGTTKILMKAAWYNRAHTKYEAMITVHAANKNGMHKRVFNRNVGTGGRIDYISPSYARTFISQFTHEVGDYTRSCSLVIRSDLESYFKRD